MEKPNEVTQIRKLLKAKNLWMKKSSEGTNSLLRSVSVCLYFTERYSDNIKNLMMSFFNLQYVPKLTSENQLKIKERYLENMFRLEFERLNLDILSKLFNVELVIYFYENSSLKKEIFNSEAPVQIKLARISELHYVGLFSVKQKESFVHVQNIVLSMIESVHNNKRFQFLNLNNSKLLNFDYLKWYSQSTLIETTDSSFNLIDYSLYLLNTEDDSLTNGGLDDDSFHNKTNHKNVGFEIISLFKKRRNSKKSNRETNSFPQQRLILDGFANRTILLNTNHCNSIRNQRKITSSKKQENQLIQHKNSDILKEFYEFDSIKNQSNFNLNNFTGDIDIYADHDLVCSQKKNEMASRKNSTFDDFSAFGEKNFINSDKHEHSNLGEFKGKDRNASLNDVDTKTNLLNPGVSTEGNRDQKTVKESLKDKLKKKKLEDQKNGKTDPIKGFPINEIFYNQPKSLSTNIEVKQTSQSVTDNRQDPSHKFITELKGAQLGKEKYSETVESKVYQGVLKFFDDKNGFGFFQIVKENNLEDVFVYKSEFDKANIKIESLKPIKNMYNQTFSFQIAIYYVSSDRRKKAINIKLV